MNTPKTYIITRVVTIMLCCFASAGSLQAQTIWTNGAGDSTWSTPGNWSNGVPGVTSNVQIGSQPSFNLIGVDTAATVIGSLTFNNTLTGNVGIAPFFVDDTLQVNGDITNSSSHGVDFSLVVSAGANSTWSGPLSFSNNVNIDNRQVTLAGGGISFIGPKLNFTLNSTSDYGRFLGSGTASYSGTTIDIYGSYTGVFGDSFDLTTGNFSGATLGILPTLGGGLSWDTTNFFSTGTLTVVPEPSTWMLTILGLGALVALRLRRRPTESTTPR